MRGTDYVRLKPAGHGIQPSVNDVINKVNEFQKVYDYIYLATDEENVEKLFRKIFGNKIIVNKRTYLDKEYSANKDAKYIAEIKPTNISNYDRGIQYISSIYLLSRCNALIAGNCTGSREALIINGGG